MLDDAPHPYWWSRWLYWRLCLRRVPLAFHPGALREAPIRCPVSTLQEGRSLWSGFFSFSVLARPQRATWSGGERSEVAARWGVGCVAKRSQPTKCRAGSRPRIPRAVARSCAGSPCLSGLACVATPSSASGVSGEGWRLAGLARHVPAERSEERSRCRDSRGLGVGGVVLLQTAGERSEARLGALWSGRP